MPPIITAAFGALGAATLARVLVREWRRVNAELDQVSAAAAERVDRERLPKLRRDPRTGVYRPE
ncbi:MAG: hypothetical protein JNM23_01210 [Bradyrhizobiaceae bacterium]|nr:hypothetical protein [Bradyrhizobiaceae bacterium]